MWRTQPGGTVSRLHNTTLSTKQHFQFCSLHSFLSVNCIIPGNTVLYQLEEIQDVAIES